MTVAVDTVQGGRVVRFTRAERWLHWTNAALFLILLVTGMTLYVPALSRLVARRVLVKDIHVYSGLLLPVPLLAAYAGHWRDAVRRDVRRLARWSVDDRRWLLTFGRRGKAAMGKFNAGQKVNAIFVAGCIPLLLVTGGIMRWFDPFPLAWRTGATFVHDWLALTLLAVIVGHIAKALAEPVSLRAMAEGTVPAAHAERRHPRWWAEIQGDPAAPRPARSSHPRSPSARPRDRPRQRGNVRQSRSCPEVGAHHTDRRTRRWRTTADMRGPRRDGELLTTNTQPAVGGRSSARLEVMSVRLSDDLRDRDSLILGTAGNASDENETNVYHYDLA